MKIRLLLLLTVFATATIVAQTTTDNYSDGSTYEEPYLAPINDYSRQGQMYFVAELLDLAGYVIEKMEVYQTLPNHGRVFRVKYNEGKQGGFIFIRWDSKKKENYVANKMIDPGVYYNLKAAKEIMRNQTDATSFGVEDGALQAPDQEKISPDDLEGLRQQYELQQEEKKLKELERSNKQKKRRKNTK
ncbi:MAG: hypothetical protein ACPHSE_01325 [Flavobacteriaceae bacterium]